MTTIVVKPRNRKEAATLKKVLKALDADFSMEENESLSPSNDPYFDNPKNIEELNKRIADIRSGKEKSSIVLKNKEDIKEFLGL